MEQQPQHTFPTVRRTSLKTRLGKAIQAIRSELALSQEELAARAGLHRTYISDIERGARNPSLESIEKLAIALNIPLPQLFERTMNPRAGNNGLFPMEVGNQVGNENSEPQPRP
ncbi:MAG TPA: helix-turn-helix transcriptional regulator [Chthoniobacteraceae bacterium]|nr:helix-turn-helix transcriptional regulator [Chthoniobacteraceae bacterium]